VHGGGRRRCRARHTHPFNDPTGPAKSRMGMVSLQHVPSMPQGHTAGGARPACVLRPVSDVSAGPGSEKPATRAPHVAIATRTAGPRGPNPGACQRNPSHILALSVGVAAPLARVLGFMSCQLGGHRDDRCTFAVATVRLEFEAVARAFCDQRTPSRRRRDRAAEIRRFQDVTDFCPQRFKEACPTTFRPIVTLGGTARTQRTRWFVATWLR